MSGAVASISFGFLLAAVNPIFAAISSALPGFFNFFLRILAAFLTPRMKSPNPSACIV